MVRKRGNRENYRKNRAARRALNRSKFLEVSFKNKSGSLWIDGQEFTESNMNGRERTLRPNDTLYVNGKFVTFEMLRSPTFYTPKEIMYEKALKYDYVYYDQLPNHKYPNITEDVNYTSDSESDSEDSDNEDDSGKKISRKKIIYDEDKSVARLQSIVYGIAQRYYRAQRLRDARVRVARLLFV
jgi:hypothetical protein